MLISCNVETGARPQVSSKYWDYFNKVFVLRIFEYLPFGTFGKEFLPQFLDLRLKSMKFLDNRAIYGCAKRVKSFRKLASKSLVISLGMSEKVIEVCKILYY